MSKRNIFLFGVAREMLDKAADHVQEYGSSDTIRNWECAGEVRALNPTDLDLVTLQCAMDEATGKYLSGDTYRRWVTVADVLADYGMETGHG